jgi:hypothetical protein
MAAGNRKRRERPQPVAGKPGRRAKNCPVMGKRSWRSVADALAAAAELAARSGHLARPYLCEHCGRWHLTSQPERR